MCSPRPPTLSQSHMNLQVWSRPRRNYMTCYITSKSVQKFWNDRRSKFALFQYFGFLQQHKQWQNDDDDDDDDDDGDDKTTNKLLAQGSSEQNEWWMNFYSASH